MHTALYAVLPFNYNQVIYYLAFSPSNLSCFIVGVLSVVSTEG